MITRIPQPQMWGPSPAESEIQAAEVANRNVATFMAGVQEAAKNHIVKQQLAQQNQQFQQTNALEKQKAQTESDRLRMGLLSQDLQKALENDGLMSYVDRKPEWLQLFGFMAGGDKALAQSMYEGGAGALNRMSALDFARRGLVGTAQAQAAPAAGGQQQAASQAQPQQQAQPQAQPPIGMWQGSPGAAPSTQGRRLPDAIEGRQGIAIVPDVQQPGSMSQMFKQTTQGVPQGPAQAVAQMAFDKLAAGQSVTAKDQAAIKSALTPQVQVLQGSELKKYLEAGGTQEALNRAVDQLNNALQDPQFAQYFKAGGYLNDKDVDNFNKYLANDVKLQQAQEKIRHDLQLENAANMTAAIKAVGLQKTMDTLQTRLSIMRQNANTRDAQLAYSKELNAEKLLEAGLKEYEAQADKVLAPLYAKGGKPTPEEIRAELDKGMADPHSGLTTALNAAARLYSGVTGDDVKETTSTLVTGYVLSIPFLPKGTEQITVPELPPATQSSRPGAMKPTTSTTLRSTQSRPAAPAAPVQGKMTDQQLIDASRQ